MIKLILPTESQLNVNDLRKLWKEELFYLVSPSPRLSLASLDFLARVSILRDCSQSSREPNNSEKKNPATNLKVREIGSCH